MIVSIDVGIIHLALLKGYTKHFESCIFPNKSATMLRIADALLIDLRNIKHEHVSSRDCTLHHSNELCDRISHFLQEYKSFFENVKHIYMEQQPITGLKSVEQLLMHHFRSKITLISPNSVHKYFGMSADYDTRKNESVQLSTPYLNHLPLFQTIERKHDLADACLLLLFFFKIDCLMPNDIEEWMEWSLIDTNPTQSYRTSHNFIGKRPDPSSFFHQYCFQASKRSG